jgi:hypothetical protein
MLRRRVPDEYQFALERVQACKRSYKKLNRTSNLRPIGIFTLAVATMLLFLRMSI